MAIWDLYRDDDSFSYLGVPIYLHRSRSGLCRIYHEYSAEMISRLKGIDRDIGGEIKSKRNHYVHFLLTRNVFIFPIGYSDATHDLFLYSGPTAAIIIKSLRALRNISAIFPQYNYILPWNRSFEFFGEDMPNSNREIKRVLTSLPKCVMVTK